MKGRMRSNIPEGMTAAEWAAEWQRTEAPLRIAAVTPIVAPVKWRDRRDNVYIPIYASAGIDGFTRPICTLHQGWHEEERERTTGEGWWHVVGTDDTVDGREHPLHGYRFETYQAAWAAIEGCSLRERG